MGQCCEKPDHMALMSLDDFMKNQELWAGNDIECWKQDLIGHFMGAWKVGMLREVVENRDLACEGSVQKQGLYQKQRRRLFVWY